MAGPKMVRIGNLYDALNWGDEWMRYADELEERLLLAETEATIAKAEKLLLEYPLPGVPF